jgi:hypothetical protein
MLVALAGVKSVPIGTVFRSKEQKCTNLVRFTGFLVLLSRFVEIVQGIIPAPAWIEEEEGLGLILGGSVTGHFRTSQLGSNQNRPL